MVAEEDEPSHHELQAGSRENALEIEEVFKHSAPASSDTLPSTRLYLSLLKQHYRLGTGYQAFKYLRGGKGISLKPLYSVG